MGHVDWQDGIIEPGINCNQVDQRLTQLHRTPQCDVVGMIRVGAAVLVSNLTGFGILHICVRRINGCLNAERGSVPTKRGRFENPFLVVPDRNFVPSDSDAFHQGRSWNATAVSVSKPSDSRERGGANLVR